jgi:hypothetical protein
MEIRKVQAAAMRRRAQSLREAACGFSSGVARTLLELADSIDAEAALLEAKAGRAPGRGGEGR